MFDDLMNLFFRGMSPSTPIERTAVDGFIVSTVDTKDCGPETAILDKNGAHPVQRYTSIEDAKAGHNKWTCYIKEGIRDITELGYGHMLEDKKIVLVSEDN